MLPLVARLLLAAVFGASGAAKLFDRGSFRQALVEFGIPASLAPELSVLLPGLEIAIAGVLLPDEVAWYGALATLVLLVTFSATIGANLLRGRRPRCGCFGRISAGPIGWRTLARNGALGGVAVLVVSPGPGEVGPSALAWLGELSLEQQLTLGGFGLLLSFVAFQAWLLAQVARETGRLLLRLAMLEERLAGLTAASLHQLGEASAWRAVGLGGPGFDFPPPNGETITSDPPADPPTAEQWEVRAALDR